MGNVARNASTGSTGCSTWVIASGFASWDCHDEIEPPAASSGEGESPELIKIKTDTNATKAAAVQTQGLVHTGLDGSSRRILVSENHSLGGRINQKGQP
jgi:hypothetical protein